MSHIVEDVENQNDVNDSNSKEGTDSNRIWALQDLPMFQADVDGMDKEIEKLGMEENCYSVHSVLEKKNT